MIAVATRFSVAAVPDKIKPATNRLRAVSFVHAVKGLADDLTEGGRVNAKLLKVTGARTATGFDSGTDGICGAQRSKCATQKAGAD
ncbi:hypothetical protein GGE46_002913 [Rhizobium etli]|uniref:Uncharacterized protein n=1 Tax=Rhizobium etli TaxID=29449 RepID=A0A7W6V9Y1_RHIET|nr:hypothetical protein [Rhizobium etli]MBB4480330.1 hypothetical protein [Rhizobium etli]MBB4536120.1 hypothetical protein [Rhizobium etli]